MIRLIQYLIMGHVHIWDKPEKEGPIFDNRKDTFSFNVNAKERPVGHYYICSCKTCGAWKRFDLK